jgi:hypothetical protein
MNIRTYRKILKRCRNKFENDKRRRHRNMPYEEIISILTTLEKKVWKIEGERQCRIADEIIEELKAKGEW